MRRLYFDYNASTPIAPEVKAEMLYAMERGVGNASSNHTEGRIARNLIETARSRVALSIGAKADEIVFTSGGTEANNLAIFGSCLSESHPSSGKLSFWTSPIEHSSVRNALQYLKSKGHPVSELPVSAAGFVLEPESYPSTLHFLALMHANNELGTIQDISSLTQKVRNLNALILVDAIQTLGKIPLNVKELNANFVTLSAHKIFGPKGVGALYIKTGTPFSPTSFGGHQENNLRPGTENLLGIVGFGKACEIALKNLTENSQKVKYLRDLFEKELLSAFPEVRIHGIQGPRLPNTSSVSFYPYAHSAKTLFQELDLLGISVSTGSACNSSNAKPSEVLLSLGLDPKIAASTLRFSFGHDQEESDIRTATKIIFDLLKNSKSLR